MEIVVCVLIVLVIVSLVLALFIGIRNDPTYDFLLSVSNLCHAWNIRHIKELITKDEESAYEWVYKKLPDYPKILYSFKPLKLESWLSKELIDKLME